MLITQKFNCYVSQKMECLKFIITVEYKQIYFRKKRGFFYYPEMCLGKDMFSTFTIVYISFPREGLKCAEKQKLRENYLLYYL